MLVRGYLCKSSSCMLVFSILVVFCPVGIPEATAMIEWERTFGNTNVIEKGVMALQTDDGGYILLGNVLSYRGEVGYISNIWVIKTDSDGNEIWNVTFKRVESERIFSCRGGYIAQTDDGGYLVIGEVKRIPLTYEETMDFWPEIWLIKINQDGMEEWNVTFPDKDFRMAKQTFDGGLIIVGKKKGQLFG